MMVSSLLAQDSVMTLALAVNNSIANNESNCEMKSISCILTSELAQVVFEGHSVSREVSYSN